VRTADPSADGRRSAAIFATVELPSTGGISSRSPRGDTLFLKGTGYLRTVLARYWHCPHNKRSGVYKTVQCPSCLSVCPYVCTIRPLQQRAAGLLLSSRRVGDVDRDRCTAGAAAARRSAANAGSATFSAYAGRRTQTWGPIYKISYDNLTIILR